DPISIYQSGDNNTGVIYQQGDYNSASITQVGNDNYAKVEQYGDNWKSIPIQQIGDGISITIIQK
ncbi:MAG TPA: curlin repeat-containing protein, partial [Ignavibacteriales bacterium]|nr:curlin repeat-containing protein [Ignavibacteriales bacterium]